MGDLPALPARAWKAFRFAPMLAVLGAALAVWPAAGTEPEGPLRACAEGRAPCPEALCASLPARCGAGCQGGGCVTGALCARVADRCALAPAGGCAREVAGSPGAPCGDRTPCSPGMADLDLAEAPSQRLYRSPLGPPKAREDEAKGSVAQRGGTAGASQRPPPLTVAAAGSPDLAGAEAGRGPAPEGTPEPSGRQVVGPLGRLLDPAAVGSGAPGLIGGPGPPGDPDPNVLHPCDNPGSGCGIFSPQGRPAPAGPGSTSSQPGGVVEAPAKPFQFPRGGDAAR